MGRAQSSKTYKKGLAVVVSAEIHAQHFDFSKVEPCKSILHRESEILYPLKNSQGSNMNEDELVDGAIATSDEARRFEEDNIYIKFYLGTSREGASFGTNTVAKGTVHVSSVPYRIRAVSWT